jgi:hypothetical protein
MKTGRLRYAGIHQLGVHEYYYSHCVDCYTMFPHINQNPSCNGQVIHLCPWCRPDSESHKNGRGL